MKETRDRSAGRRAGNSHPIVQRLYASCRAKRDYYRELGMEFEAQVFEKGLRQLEERFGIAPDPEV
jgi:hypothetical protein